MDILNPASQITALLNREEPGFFFPGCSRREATLLYAEDGSVHCIAEGTDYLLSQGDFIVLPPECWYMTYAPGGCSPNLLQITFCPEFADFRPLTGRSEDYLDIPDQLCREWLQADAYASQMQFLLVQQLLLLLQRQQALLPRPAPKGEHEILYRAQKAISLRARQKLSVPLVAQLTGVSPSYLTALFHKHLPLSPGEYIRRVKLQESRQMIREGELNFTQIAAALEYSTVHHFSRQFKDNFGMTPSEYARLAK